MTHVMTTCVMFRANKRRALQSNGRKGNDMTKREHNLVTRLSDEEIAMAKALSEALDEPMTRLVRRLLRAEYVSRIGLKPPPKHTQK
jgi:hypothetical protein